MNRKRGIAAIEFLGTPMLPVQLKELRKLYKGLQQDGSVSNLIAGVEAMQSAFGGTASEPPQATVGAAKLRRDDLRLICFDVLSSD